MRVSVLVALLVVPATLASAAPRQASRSGQAIAVPTSISGAYEQFLLARHLESADDVDGAIAAYKRAAQLDPTSADIVAELAGLYLRQSRLTDAIGAADQALKVDPDDREAHRVLGIVYATLAESGRGRNGQRPQGPTASQGENIARAIQHLEKAVAPPIDNPDPNVRATLARLYIASGTFDKAIPLLVDLVNQEPGWSDGPALLAEAYAGAGRNDDAIKWLEEAAPGDPDLYATLGEFYEREHKWKEAAAAYGEAVKNAPRNADLKTRQASALLNAGGRDATQQARDELADAVAARPTDTRALYLLSQAQRRLGDPEAAEATARRFIAQNNRSPMGYFALASALAERRQYQAIVDALAPAVAEFKSRGATQASDLGVLLPHLGFAYQELGEYDKALATFDEAHRLSPDDPAVTGYLIEANIAAKKYPAALTLAQQALEKNPDDLRFARLDAQALRQSGRTDEAVSVLQQAVKSHADDPDSYVALAQLYSDARRGGDAVKVLQDAEGKFPDETAIPFELGAVFEKQKRYADAESAFRQVLAKDPDNAAALNYLGYMLADRGERLDESIGYLRKAVTIEPDNGSYLDSLGWAYFKSDKLDLALDNLHRTADQLRTNSVIQDHYGDALFKAGRYDDALAAWNRALAGDGDSIDRGAIEKKIRTAKQKLPKK